MEPESKLRAIKAIHTVVWAVFAGSILAIPTFTVVGDLSVAWGLIGFVFLEVIVLVANRMRCPLTDVAGRYTSARALAEDSYIQVELSTDRRTIRTGAAVKRRIRERGDDFYGLEFIDMGPEDFRFLFELLYGRPFTDDDADLVEGLPPPLR